jgi:phospholipid/cholesterol/gamma-HCH transport system substrate-binding protein
MASQKRVGWAQLRSGIVATVAMIIAAVLIFLLTGQGNFFAGEFELKTYLDDSAGMTQNAPVRVNGILAGHIKSVSLSGLKDPKKTVEVVMAMNDKYRTAIPIDSKAAISASNLLGDKYINISKGTNPTPVQPGAEIAALQTQDIPEILAQSSQLLGQFQSILTRLDGIVSVVENGQGNIGKLLKDDTLYNRLVSTAAEVEQIAKDVRNSNGTLSKVLYDDALYNDIRKPIQRIDDILAQVQSGKGSAGKLLNDTAIYDEARASIAEAKKLLDNLNAGKGTAGKLLNDEQVYQQLNLITTKVNQAIDKVNSGQGTVGQLVVNPQLYDSATSLTRELDSLLKDVHSNPKKFLTIRLVLF